MAEIKLKARSFKKMDDPIDKKGGHVKYVCYAKANTIPDEILDWMETNPRQQNMKTTVALNIINSLKINDCFHELNRGIVLSADEVSYDNKEEVVKISLNDVAIHGDIDGGHTLRAIIDLKNKGELPENRYVFFEIFTGIDSPVELASARNISNQVDLKSIQELEKNFEIIKEAVKDTEFANKISYKMYEQDENNVKKTVDVREIIAILMMFFQNVYPCTNEDGTLNEMQPVKCYTGKEATLKKFVDIGKEEREATLKNMKNIISDIFHIWDQIEMNFNEFAKEAGRRYLTRNYAKYKKDVVQATSLVSQKPMEYVVPRGLIYPIVGAFRALVRINPETNEYYWVKNPELVLKRLGGRLVGIVLDEKTDSPEYIGKSSNLWNNLFKEVYIEGPLL